MKAMLLVWLTLCCVTEARGQAIVRGRVLTVDSAAIAGARVEVKDSTGRLSYSMATDSAGQFWLRMAGPVRPGTYFVSTDMIGFRPVNDAPLLINDRDEITVRMTLAVDVIMLEPLHVFTRKAYVRGPRDEYYDRADQIRRMGGGTVIDYEMLERRVGLPLSIVLSEHIPNTRSCAPSYFIDGMRALPDDVHHLPVSSIEGIEIYRSLAMVPPQYQGRGTCTTVLIWTQVGDRGQGSPLTWRRVFMALGFIALGVLLLR